MADEKIRADDCPDCGEALRESSRFCLLRTRIGGMDGDEQETTDHAWTAACPNGHIWNVTSACNMTPRLTLEGRADQEAVPA